MKKIQEFLIHVVDQPAQEMWAGPVLTGNFLISEKTQREYS